VIIPKIIIQTSIDRPKDYIVKRITELSPEWSYNHFTDEDILDFFEENPIEEFKNISDKFNSIIKGEHKADLFRYYFLYLKGGVFIDSDAMILLNMDNIAKNYEFFSVKSLVPNSIFQGFLGSIPKNRIIYKALKDAYNISNDDLNNEYLILTKHLYQIIDNDKNNYKIKLFNERWVKKGKISESYDNETGKVILKHYQGSGYVPENTIPKKKKGDSRSIYLILK
jgi:hypothetical protein